MQAWTLVTGAAKGLGAEICLTLASQGYSIAIHFNESKKEAEELAKSCRALGAEAEIIQGNFSTQPTLENFVARYQREFTVTQFLIHNVGPFVVKSPLNTTPEEWHALFQTNVQAPLFLMQSLSESLKTHQGAIVSMGVAGLLAARADLYSTAYSAAKMSLWMLTKAVARELAPFNVSANMVSPGYLENSQVVPKDVANIPMHRLGTLSEVARLILFLLQPENRYITGQNIEIAGGVRL